MKRILLLVFLPVLCLLSCGKEDFADNEPDNPADGGEIVFDIGFAPQTRVSTGADFTSDWETGDEIGIFAVSHGQGLSAIASDNYIHNAKLVRQANGSWYPESTFYWPANGNRLDFYAYYPYDAAATDPTAITFNVKDDQSGVTGGKSNYNLSDLLTAKANNNGAGYVGGAAVPLTFSHALALVQISVRSGNDPGSIMNNEIDHALTGLKTGASLNLATGVVAATGNAGEMVMFRVEKPADVGYTTQFTYRALVPPQTIAAGTPLFHLSKGDYTMTHIPAAQAELLSGKVTPYEITLKAGVDPNHKYKVGDVYPHTGFLLGVVFRLDESAPGYDAVTASGPKGKIVGPLETRAAWGPEGTATGATDRNNGLVNMATVTAMDNALANYPAFAWADALNPAGAGYQADAGGVWYLPAINEVSELHRQRIAVNNALTANGWTALSIGGSYYWSSTEGAAYDAFALDFFDGHEHVHPKDGNMLFVRSILAF